MDRREIFLQLKLIIEKHVDEEVDVSNAGENTNFLNELNLDSVNLINLLVDIEDVFSITMEPEELDNIFLIKDVIDIISRSLK